ncbi:hypothetical protein [Mycolicibacterium sp.]|uniref:hypothetical protein n=1 Tax=Mycolicibacterium sp. TaxID=2320850 RepID=UPI0037CA7C09
MRNARGRAMATTSGLMLAVVVPTIATGHADPLPASCMPPNVVDNVCTARLTSVTADAVNGTVTGTPVGGSTAITLAGQGDVYLKSTGFGDAAPEAVKQWDATIDSVSSLSVDPSDPNWYGNAKSRVFMPRTLNDLATGFPLDTLLVRFAPDDAAPGTFRLVSIQPTPVS